MVGLYKMIFGGNFRNNLIYAPQPAVLDAAKKNDRANTLYVRSTMHTPASAAALTAALEDTFKAANMPVSNMLTLIYGPPVGRKPVQYNDRDVAVAGHYRRHGGGRGPNRLAVDQRDRAYQGNRRAAGHRRPLAHRFMG